MGGAGRRAAHRGIGHSPAAGRGALVRLRRAVGGVAAALDAGRRRGLRDTPGAGPRQGDRRGACRAPGLRARPRPLPLSGGCRGPNGAARGGDRTTDPGRRVGLAWTAASRAAVAAPRSDGGHARPNGELEAGRPTADRSRSRSAPAAQRVCAEGRLPVRWAAERRAERLDRPGALQLDSVGQPGGRWICACRRPQRPSCPR